MRIPEREVMVGASYAVVFEPALGALYEGCFPQIQRRTGVNGKERAVSEELAAKKGGTAESFGPLRDEGAFFIEKISVQ